MKEVILAVFVSLCLCSSSFADIILDIEKGRLDIIKKRLAKNPNLIAESNEKKLPLVALAVDRKNFEVTKHLVENGADPSIFDGMGRTALHTAVARQNLEMVKYLISKGMNVNTKNKHGETALAEALFSGNTETTKYLLEKGADVNAKDQAGNSVIHALQVGKKNFKELFQLLWAVKDKQGKHVLDLEARNQNGETLLMKCLTNTKGENAAQILIAAGAKLEGKSINNETPLLAAIANEHSKVVDLLLKKKVDVNVKDKVGNSPMQYALLQNNTKLIEALLQNGAILTKEDRELVKFTKHKQEINALFDEYADKNNKLLKKK